MYNSLENLNNTYNNDVYTNENSASIKRKKATQNTKKMVYMGLLVALTAAMSQIAIPMPIGIPFTLQTFAIAFVAYFLGWKYGVVTICIYVALGAFGAPIFSNFQGGIGKMVGLTGGFIWGFIPMAFLTGLANKKKNIILSIFFGILGLLSCHLLGVLQFHFVTQIEWKKCFLIGSLPYMPKDIFTTILAYLLAKTLKNRLKFKEI